jgi:hypothetical protein
MKSLLEYLGGSTDEPPEFFRVRLSSYFWGIWWGILICLIVFFCGQSSKFIYIDF